MGCMASQAASPAHKASTAGPAKSSTAGPAKKPSTADHSGPAKPSPDTTIRMCPACGIYIEKLDGDDTMMCGCEGRPAGGTYEKALAAGGCGHEFNWSTLEPIACGKPGAPANERQIHFGIVAPAPPSVTPHIVRPPTASSLPVTIKVCPACGIYIEKLDGDDNMMCGCEGRPAGGTYEKALAGGGCGHEFNWATLEPVACGRPGAPANDRQINFVSSEFSTPKHQPDKGTRAKITHVDSKYISVFDNLLKATYVAKCTQDRECPTGVHPKTPGGCVCVQLYPEDVLADMPGVRGLPAAFRVQQVIRNADSQMWAKYTAKRQEIRDRRRSERLKRVAPALLTTEVVSKNPYFFGALDAECNEAYLLHGTPVTSALEILQNDFKVDLAGRATGTMYGNGVYLCESSTKADEHSKDYVATALEGTFAMVICRVTLGKFFYTLERDSKAGSKIDKGHFDSTVGDRAKSAGTFREFVVYNKSQLYPEYIVIYHRVHVGDKPQEIEERLKAKLDLGWGR